MDAMDLVAMKSYFQYKIYWNPMSTSLYWMTTQSYRRQILGIVGNMSFNKKIPLKHITISDSMTENIKLKFDQGSWMTHDLNPIENQWHKQKLRVTD